MGGLIRQRNNLNQSLTEFVKSVTQKSSRRKATINQGDKDMAEGKLIEMGRIEIVGLEDEPNIKYKMVLVIEFDSPEEIREAIKEGTCTFKFGSD